MNIQKKVIQPIKQNNSYGLGNPDIYIRIDKEREKLKNIKIFIRQKGLKIIYNIGLF